MTALGQERHQRHVVSLGGVYKIILSLPALFSSTELPCNYFYCVIKLLDLNLKSQIYCGIEVNQPSTLFLN